MVIAILPRNHRIDTPVLLAQELPRLQFSWKFFTAEFSNLMPGEHTIVSRATDTNGVMQPEELALTDKKTMWENNGQFVRKFSL